MNGDHPTCEQEISSSSLNKISLNDNNCEQVSSRVVTADGPKNFRDIRSFFSPEKIKKAVKGESQKRIVKGSHFKARRTRVRLITGALSSALVKKSRVVTIII